MTTLSIDDLTCAHWRDTLVLQGETPEAYAIRREEEAIRWLHHVLRDLCATEGAS